MYNVNVCMAYIKKMGYGSKSQQPFRFTRLLESLEVAACQSSGSRAFVQSSDPKDHNRKPSVEW